MRFWSNFNRPRRLIERRKVSSKASRTRTEHLRNDARSPRSKIASAQKSACHRRNMMRFGANRSGDLLNPVTCLPKLQGI